MKKFSTVLHKRNATPGAVPTIETLSSGEIAINPKDVKLFIRSAEDTIESFLSEGQLPYKLDSELSAVAPQYGHNVVNQVLSNILGGYSNNISGAASTIVNGEQNGLSADFGFIGSGAENIISPAGDFSAILGGHHNLIAHSNSFVLGSNLSSHAPDFTYVNNISGTYYGDGSNLTGIVSPVGVYVPLSGGIITGDLTILGTLSSANGVIGGADTGTNYLSSYVFYGDGETTSFDLGTSVPQTNPAGYIVNLNGATQVPHQDYIIEYNSGTNKLVTLFVPVLGCNISVVYLGSRISSSTIIYSGGGSGGSDVSTLSSNWQNTYTTVLANSANWGSGGSGSDVSTLSSNWQNTYTTVLANSANWNYQGLDIKSLSSSWESSYTTVLANSAQWSITTDTTKLAISGGTISGNLLVTGSLSVLSGATFINTVFNNTSALQINNSGIGPALYVYQGPGAGDIASFYDGDGIEVLHVGNALNPVAEGVVGINTSYPNKTLTVAGTISAKQEMWASAFYGDGSNLTGVIKTQYTPPANATFTSSVSAPALSGTFYGDGSRLTGIPSGLDATKLPLSGGALTGGLTGTQATFTNSVSAPTYYGDGSNLTGIAATLGFTSQTQVQYIASGVVKVYQTYNSSTNSLDTVFN